MADNVEVRGLAELERLLIAYPRLVQRAARRSIDRTATAVRKLTVDRIADDTTVQKRALNRNVKVSKRTTQTSLEAKVSISRKPILIREFKPKTRLRRSQVAADISTKPGQGVEIIRKAFKPLGKPKKAIYERAVIGGKRVGRFPIKLASGPSAAVMVQPLMPKILEKGSQVLRRTFSIELEKEAARVNAR